MCSFCHISDIYVTIYTIVLILLRYLITVPYASKNSHFQKYLNSVTPFDKGIKESQLSIPWRKCDHVATASKAKSSKRERIRTHQLAKVLSKFYTSCWIANLLSIYCLNFHLFLACRKSFKVEIKSQTQQKRTA